MDRYISDTRNPQLTATSISTTLKSLSKAKRDARHERASAPADCRQSLHGPRRCSSSTGLTSAITPAPPTASPTTPTPDHQAAQLARAAPTRSLDECIVRDPSGHSPCWLASRAHSVHTTECARRANSVQRLDAGTLKPCRFGRWALGPCDFRIIHEIRTR